MLYSNANDQIMTRGLILDLRAAGFPKTYDVSRQVYEAAERCVLDWVNRARRDPFMEDTMAIGPNGGLMLKNVELIIVQS